MTELKPPKSDDYNRQAGGRFGPGNPGKPMGAKHRANADSWRALDDMKSAAFAVLKQKLAEHDLKAAIFIASRFLPTERLIELPSNSPEAWADAMAEGIITPGELAKAAAGLKTITDVSVVNDLRARLDELEQSMLAEKDGKR